MPTNFLGVAQGGNDYASRTYAALTRQQWDQYLSTFVPLENQLIDYALDDNAAANAARVAQEEVGRSFETQQGIQQRRLRGLGLTLNADEQQAADRQTGLAKSLAEVNSANLTTRRVQDRQQSLIGNPAPSIPGGA